MSFRIVPILGAALALAACASFPPPTNTVASSLAAVRGAEELGAADVPQAALQLQLAQEEVAKAKRLMADGENERAHYMALRASNDAELAIVLTRENAARRGAVKARQGADAAKSTEVTP
jgi:siroheme synthase